MNDVMPNLLAVTLQRSHTQLLLHRIWLELIKPGRSYTSKYIQRVYQPACPYKVGFKSLRGTGTGELGLATIQDSGREQACIS